MINISKLTNQDNLLDGYVHFAYSSFIKKIIANCFREEIHEKYNR
jgi:hypothetical protein